MTEKVSEDFIKRLNDYQPVEAHLPEGMEYPFDDEPIDEDEDETE
jgi:hypothetical protein